MSLYFIDGGVQVVICHNHLSSQEEVSHALTHELIHAYDHCRSRDLDWSNCEHHACSEAHSPPAVLSAGQQSQGVVQSRYWKFCFCCGNTFSPAPSEWVIQSCMAARVPVMVRRPASALLSSAYNTQRVVAQPPVALSQSGGPVHFAS